jgi:hypothetical protein
MSVVVVPALSLLAFGSYIHSNSFLIAAGVRNGKLSLYAATLRLFVNKKIPTLSYSDRCF